MISTPSEVITLLGGKAAVSDRVKRPITTVASWASRQSIPVDVWPQLVALANKTADVDLTYETLVRLHAKPAPKKRRAA